MAESTVPITPEELHHLSLFRSAPFHEVEQVVAQCTVHEIPQGEIVISGGEVNERMYLVLEGELTVRLESADAAPMTLLSAGDMFGELSLIDDSETSAYVVAEKPCRVVSLGKDDLWELFKRTPYVAHNLLLTLTDRMRASNKLIERLRRIVAEGD